MAYSYIRVLPDEFLLKSTVMTTDFKRNSSGRSEYMNIHTPINALVSALLGWLPIEQLLLFKDTIMAYKCVNNLAPNYLCNKFRKRSELHEHDHPMRHQDLLNTHSIELQQDRQRFNTEEQNFGAI